MNFSNNVLGTAQFFSLTGGFGGDKEMWTATPVTIRKATLNVSSGPDIAGEGLHLRVYQ